MSEAKIIIPTPLKEFLEVEHCDDFPIRRYYVTQEQKDIIEDILRMRRITDEMQKMKIPYLNTTILHGPTGTGKTTFCRYIAYKLDLDFAYINFAKLIEGGILGNTARNVSAIFRFMAETECIFVLDEIDCIATKRGNESAATGGEMTRITLTLMQELDYYRKHRVKSVIIACTNRLDMIDPALISRFSIKKEIGPMKNEDKMGYIIKFLEDVGIQYDEQNIRTYCARNSTLKQRNIEADITRCIAKWIENDRKNFVIDHIRETEYA